MPKRNNPFGDHSSLQLKTHIGVKEVDKGVDEKTRMQSVYDKTHDMLYSGMKSYMNDNEKEEMNNNNSFGIDREMVQNGFSNSNDHLKQMHIGSHCQLVTDDVDMDACENGVCKESPTSCSSASGFHADFMYGRTPNEHSPPSFISAASLMVTPQPSPVHTESNIFEKMKQAQLQMASKSGFSSGACHSCTRPVLSRDVMKCQFCENYVCSACTRQCAGCFLHFCQLCSILNYSQAKERAFCFGCNER